MIRSHQVAQKQVMDGYGQWQMVDALGEDQVLLMPGHALEYALCGLLTAAQHRVVCLKACCLVSAHRQAACSYFA